MSHCADSYVYKCVTEDCWQYHLRDTAEHGVTVEIVLKDDIYLCTQAMGHGNAPNDEILKLTRSYLNEVERNEILSSDI